MHPSLSSILILTCLTHVHLANIQSQQSALGYNDMARIKCEYRQSIAGDSLVLNCTLLTGIQTSGQQTNDNGMSFIANGNVGSSNGAIGGTSGSSLNIRVGVESGWRSPWESLNINHRIIRNFVWRQSRLTELGQFAFKDLDYIQHIDLAFNKLQQLNGFSFNNFELDVLSLDLSHNLFQQVPVDLFMNKRMQKLEVLKMNENPIVYLTRKPFEYVTGSIKTIELNYCQIRSIDINTFDDMKHVESVSLIGNHLRHLNEYTFRDLTLRSFYVHENPLVCDCKMRWLINFINNVDYQQQQYEQNIAGFYDQELTQVKSKYIPSKSVAQAASTLLRCDQPNSLKAKQSFLGINPDSFMCDVEIQFREDMIEATYDLGDDALLTCDVYGDPEPVVYWSVGLRPIEKALNNDRDKYYVHEIRSPMYASAFKSGAGTGGASSQSTNKTSELRIKNLGESDFGVYACTAEIAGSNNRKQITFNVRRSGEGALLGAGGIVVGGVSLIAAATSSLFNKPLSNWTLILLLAIVVSLIIFILMLSSFICWKCRRRKIESKQFQQHTLRRKEQEKLINTGTLNERKLLQQNAQHEDIYGNSKFLDHLDHHHNQLSNDSSATLISHNKNSSIRMAYPNPNVINSQMGHQQIQQHQFNDIYGNHSLLTTTSTGSYMANGQHNHGQQQHNPHHQGNNMESYYDDLRYNDEHIAQLQLQAHQSKPNPNQSPLVRRDDPTIPLYATLKPKLQHQRQYTSNYITSNSNYVPYSTMHRSNASNSTNTPPARRLQNTNNYQQVLPPPPPPPPPIKPKRTFEYGPSNNNNQLHSESGTFLLNGQNDYDNPEPQNFIKQREHKSGSATSLDEEDLDLNDLKDFEDMTFDNLKRPEQCKKMGASKKGRQVLIGRSEQSLLIKSSESSSANTINNVGGSELPAIGGDLNLSDKTQTTGDASSSNTIDVDEKIYEETEI